jgi:hypothetical protein
VTTGKSQAVSSEIANTVRLGAGTGTVPSQRAYPAFPRWLLPARRPFANWRSFSAGSR